MNARFPPPASLEQLDDDLWEEWYNIELETVQYLYNCISRRTEAVLTIRVNGGPTPYHQKKTVNFREVRIFYPIPVFGYFYRRV